MPDDRRFFVPGEIFWQTILTHQGWLALSAHVAAEGSVLTLSDFDCKPLHTRFLAIGVGEVLAIRQEILTSAEREGYTVVVIRGLRTSGRHPQREFDYRREAL